MQIVKDFVASFGIEFLGTFTWLSFKSWVAPKTVVLGKLIPHHNQRIHELNICDGWYSETELPTYFFLPLNQIFLGKHTMVHRNQIILQKFVGKKKTSQPHCVEFLKSDKAPVAEVEIHQSSTQTANPPRQFQSWALLIKPNSQFLNKHKITARTS